MQGLLADRKKPFRIMADCTVPYCGPTRLPSIGSDHRRIIAWCRARLIAGPAVSPFSPPNPASRFDGNVYSAPPDLDPCIQPEEIRHAEQQIQADRR